MKVSSSFKLLLFMFVFSGLYHCFATDDWNVNSSSTSVNPIINIIHSQFKGSLKSKSGSSICELSKDEGSCHAYSTKYYYDSLFENCRSFFYGGCGGNANRFDTKEQCESTCKKTTPDLCKLPRDDGYGLMNYERYYYDSLSDSCTRFSYGGYGGNNNRFDSKETCESVCKKSSGGYGTNVTGALVFLGITLGAVMLYIIFAFVIKPAFKASSSDTNLQSNRSYETTVVTPSTRVSAVHNDFNSSNLSQSTIQSTNTAPIIYTASDERIDVDKLPSYDEVSDLPYYTEVTKKPNS